VAAQPPRFFREPPPAGIVYNTAMRTPDAALALAALWSYEGQRKARVAGVCVTGSGFGAAVFCDIVNQFYRPGQRISNDALPVGLANANALPADEPMVAAPVSRTSDAGEPLYRRTLRRITDTSLAESQLRNAITFNAETTVVLSAPATSLARSLEIVANRDLYSEPVRRLVVVDSPLLHEDEAALAYLLENWPTEIVILDAGVAADLSIASDVLDRAFAWADAHPVVDAYQAFRPTPYPVPVADLLAMVFAVEPELAPFTVTGDRVRQLQLSASADLQDLLLVAAAAERVSAGRGR
jgi:hypothetical protein